MAALIAAISTPSGASSGVATAKASATVAPAVEGEPAGADLGKLGEELPDLVDLLGPGEVEEAVHLVVGDVREQSLPGGARIERTAGVGACDVGQAGRFRARMIGEHHGIPDAHAGRAWVTLVHLGFQGFVYH
jgi:hypothetical protein